MALFTPNAYNHIYNTRARNDPRVSKHHYSAFHKSFLIRSPTIWSYLGNAIKNVTTVKAFKNNFVKMKLSRY